MLSETNQVVFRVAPDATKPRDQGGGRGPVRRHGAGGEHAGAEGQDQAVQGAARRAVGREEGVRQAGRRPVDRFHHRPRIGRAEDGTQTIQSGHGEPARHRADQPFRAVEGQAGQGADRGQDSAPAGATTTAASPAGSSAAGTSSRIASSTSSARKFDVPAMVERLEYDPNRTAFIALVKYQDGELAYILAPQRLRAGDSVVCRAAGRHQAGQRDAAGGDSGRHDHPQHRDEGGRRRQDRARRRHLRAACRQGRRLRADQADVGRTAHGARRVHGQRSARCPTPTT